MSQGQALNQWIKKLSEQDMPVFSGTVTNVTQAINHEHSSATDVAQVVLRDAALTGRMLKMVNTIYFNPTNKPINTVSRAVMLLGFDKVRAVTLSLVLVDSLGAGIQRQKLIEEMGLAFHAAMQAQELARKLKDPVPEDIFVATLLSRLGYMALWAFGDKQAEQIANTDAQLSAEHEQEHLGFSIDELTKSLCKSWSLGDLLDDYLHQRGNDKRFAFIDAGMKLAQSVQQGWQSDETNAVIKEISTRFDLDVETVQEWAFSHARQAKKVTALYGSKAAGSAIPQPTYDLLDDDEATHTKETVPESVEVEKVDDNVIDEASHFPEPSIQVQMTVMQEITTTIQERPNMSIVLEMVLEGIHRGVGMDRAVFAILNPQRTQLICKHVIGNGDSQRLLDELIIDIRQTSNIFHQIIDSKRAMHVSADPRELNGTISRETLRVLGTPPYFVMPTIVKNKVIGIFLADRKASQRSLTEQDFLAFQQFCQQANMGLSFLVMQG